MGRVFVPGAPGIRGTVEWTRSWCQKTSADIRPEEQGEDGSGKGVVWEVAESREVMLSCSEFSPWIERESHSVVPRACGRDREAALQARSQAQH